MVISMHQFFTTEHLIAFILGSIIGSFANVCIHRLPSRQSIVFPASQCPHCQQAIRPWHNIPLLSYLLLKGCCASCHAPISWRYPLVEFLCGLLYVVVYHHFGLSIQSVVLALLATSLIIVSFIDLAHKIIPDIITLPGIVAGLLASFFVTPGGFASSALGVVLGGGLFFLVAILSRGGMGGGDIKLIAMIGAFLGWRAVLVTIFLGALSGAMVGIGLMLLHKKGRKDPLPFGPFLALGALFAMVWGQDVLLWYLYLS
jgi:leader peptidase (prepilin peptidase)/N-methyltransferase